VAAGLALLVLAVAAAAVAVLAVRVQGESMTPTLHSGDRVLLRPFSGSGTPHRFALVVGRFEPGGPRVVKRVIAIPGDKIRISPTEVDVQPHGAGPWQRVDNPAWTNPARTPCCTPDGAAADHATAQQVPAGMLFLLGDNPAASRDSLSLGWAPLDLIDGVVGLRIWPLPDAGRVRAHVRLRPID
jgi:signal peptidase I